MVDSNINCAGAIFYSIKSKRILFLLRTDSYRWGLVGGGIDNDETPYEGLMREIQEEIGFIPEIVKTIPLDMFTNKKFIYHTYVIIIDNEFIPTLNWEHCGYSWIDFSVLDNQFPLSLHYGVFNTLTLDVIKDKLSTIVDKYAEL